VASIHLSLNWHTLCSARGLLVPLAWLSIAGGSLLMSSWFREVLIVAFSELL